VRIVKLALSAAALVAGGTLVAAAPAAAAPNSTPNPTPGSAAYLQRDAANMAAAFGRNEAQLEDPAYLPQFFLGAASLYASQLATQSANPTRPSLTAGSLVPGFAAGDPDRAHWNGTRGEEVPVSFTASDGASLRGDVFAPKPGARDPYTGALLHGPYPGAVIVSGSIQASRDEYAWLAEDLAERGYVVLTFDVQGQGQSETLPHEGADPDLPGCGSLATQPGQVTPCPGVPSEQDQDFVDSTEDAISFFLSTPAAPYPNVDAGALPVNAYNPLWNQFDHSPDHATATPGRTTRLALIGHSTGAVIATYLQGVDPRIETVVALDKLTATPAAISDDEAETGSLPGPVVPKVPALALQSEYGFEPQPYFVADCSSFEPCLTGAPDLDAAPDPDREEATGFDTWRAAGVDSMIIVPRASTHLIYTDAPPVLPATVNGQEMASYYVQAWLAKYLKHDPDAGYQLLSPTIRYFGPDQNGRWSMHTFNRDDNLSFYFCSGYQFNGPGGRIFADPDLTGDGCS
jgi:pimeloyl-ACP methyl ester carboxylesterase